MAGLLIRDSKKYTRLRDFSVRIQRSDQKFPRHTVIYKPARRLGSCSLLSCINHSLLICVLVQSPHHETHKYFTCFPLCNHLRFNCSRILQIARNLRWPYTLDISSAYFSIYGCLASGGSPCSIVKLLTAYYRFIVKETGLPLVKNFVESET